MTESIHSRRKIPFFHFNLLHSTLFYNFNATGFLVFSFFKDFNMISEV